MKNIPLDAFGNTFQESPKVSVAVDQICCFHPARIFKHIAGNNWGGGRVFCLSLFEECIL